MGCPNVFSRRMGLAVAASALLVGGCVNSPYAASIEDGKVIVLPGSAPSTFDPTVCYDDGCAGTVALISPSFFRYKYLVRNPFGIELNLGAAMPTVEHPARAKKGDVAERWTFHLRHDLRFQDDPCFPGGKGRTVTAADLVYSLKRMADPKLECPVAMYFADKVLGWPEFSDGFKTAKKAQYDRPLKGISVDPKDPYTFVVELNQPFPQLRYLMAMSFTSPQAREAVDRYGEDYALHHPVGCGTYRLKEYVPNDRVWLTRNSNAPKELYPSQADPGLRHFLADAGQNLPRADAIYRPIMSEDVTMYNLFQQGYLDALGVGAGNAQIVPAANGLTPDMKARGVTLHRNVQMQIGYLAFNMNDPTFGGYDEKHRKLRQAISLAVNSQAYIDIVAAGMGAPAQWVLPPGPAGYDPSYRNPYRAFDPKLTKAKRLLAEAGYPNGVDGKTGERLELTFDNAATTASSRQVVRLYQKQIEALGIHVILNSLDAATEADRIKKGQFQFFDGAWFADYPDPENFALLLYGPNKSPGPNASFYANPDYDRMYERMRSMPDGPARNTLIAQMRNLSVEDCPMIYVSHPESRTLVQPWVTGLDSNPLANDGLKYVGIDATKRTTLQAQWNRASLWPLAATAAFAGMIVVPAFTTVKRQTSRKVRRRA